MDGSVISASLDRVKVRLPLASAVTAMKKAASVPVQSTSAGGGGCSCC